MSPGSTTSYTVSGTNTLGCIGSSTATIVVTPASSLTLSGNGNNIAQGSSSTSTLNFTDFGSTTTRSFVIQNTGAGTLAINSVSFTGANAAQFTIGTAPASSLTTTGTSTFSVIFSPTAIGAYSAIVSINSLSLIHI